MTVEPSRIEEWLWGLLRGDPEMQGYVGQRVFAYVAPETASLPYVVFQPLSQRDANGIGTTRIMVETVFLVRAIGVESMSTLRPIADRIDALVLEAAALFPTIGLAQIQGAVRDEPFSLHEAAAGIAYRHLGGLYRLFVK